MTKESIDLTDEDQTGRVVLMEKGHLQRLLGALPLYAIGYGDVGSSIYYALGVTTLYALGAAPLALGIAGIVFFCTVLSYTELATAIPESGGSAAFARRAFNDVVSFISGWALLLDYIVTIAISAYTVGPYLSYFFPVLQTGIGNIPFTLMIISVLFLLNVLGIRESTNVSIILTFFGNITQLTIIILGGLTLLNLPHLIDHMRIGIPNVDWSPTWPQFMKGIGMAMVAYIGIESIAQLAGETRNPGKMVPRAMMATMITLFIMYFGISVVALSALSPHELSTKYLEDPIAGIASVLPIGGEFLGAWVGVLGATILFIAANAGLIGASRLTFAMGEHFQLPQFFYRLHPRFKTPYISLFFFAGLSALTVFVAGKLTFLAELYNFGAMLAFCITHLSLIGLRIREPDLARPYKVKGNVTLFKRQIPVTAIVGALATLAVWIDVILTKPAGRNLGFTWMGLGFVLYFLYRKEKRLPAATRLEIEHLTVPEYSKVEIKKILVPTLGGRSTETVQFAASIAKTNDAVIEAVFVIEVPQALPLDTFFPDKLAQADAALERAKAIATEQGIADLKTHVLQSRSAGTSIVEMAQDQGFDLIVMGAKSTRGKTITALGRTIEFVLRNAPCRVWLFHS